MRIFSYACCTIMLLCQLHASPFRQSAYFDNTRGLNRILFDFWTQKGINFPAPASDAVFLRRVALTAAGRLPTANEVKTFLNDPSPDKRSRIIEKFLHDPGYAGMQAMRFADMLRIKSEFPINLWPNAVQLWHRTIHDELAQDRPLNWIFYEMLTVSGSNFRVPHANFFRASADRSPQGLAKMVLLTVMGINPGKIPPEMIQNTALFFSRIRYKSTYEWKEEIVYTDYLPIELHAALPDGTVKKFTSPADDPRIIFADWLIKENPAYFCRAMTNRVWHWIFGRGIYPVADDLPLKNEPGNEPFSAEVQNFLNDEFIKNNCSLRHLYRVIMNSAAFQAAFPADFPEQTAYFAAYPVRRLEAELLVDALAQITGSYDRYSSVIPEPFTFLPDHFRAVDIADGSISNGVLDTFGRPPRDAGTFTERNTASTDSQNLYLMNSATLFKRTNLYCRKLRKHKRQKAFEQIYLDILSRYPTAAEYKIFENYIRTSPNPGAALQDTVWVLINSKEFLFHH